MRVAAYVYPGWHPIPERDRSFHPGFTEWELVEACRPRFEGHHQPRVPELGAYDETVHTPSKFRSIMYRFLPEHASLSNGWASLLPFSAKSSPEYRLLEQFKAHNNPQPSVLVQKYLQFCQTLPYYGSAFFHGQIETPARSLTSLLINHDTEVLLAINPQGFYVIDPVNVVSIDIVVI